MPPGDATDPGVRAANIHLPAPVKPVLTRRCRGISVLRLSPLPENGPSLLSYLFALYLIAGGVDAIL